MRIPITPNYPSFLGYGAAGLISTQALLSLRHGIKNISRSFFGSSAYRSRVASGAFEGVIGYTNNIIFGEDDYKLRQKNFTTGVRQLGTAGLCAFIAYIFFTKGFKALDEEIQLPENPDSNQTFKADKAQVDATITGLSTESNEIKNIIQFLDFGLHYSPSDDCRSMLEEFDSEAASKARMSWFYCIKKHLQMVIYKKNYETSDRLPYYLSHSNLSPPRLAETTQIATGALLLDSATRDDQQTPQDRALSNNDNDIAAPLTATSDHLSDLKRLVSSSRFKASCLDRLETQMTPLKKRAKDRLNYHILAEMTQKIGPFTIEVNELCESGFFESPSVPDFIKSNIFNKNPCGEYNKLKEEIVEMENAKNKFIALDPASDNTNAKLEVYNPHLEVLLALYRANKGIHNYAEDNFGISKQHLEFFSKMWDEYEKKKIAKP